MVLVWKAGVVCFSFVKASVFGVETSDLSMGWFNDSICDWS